MPYVSKILRCNSRAKPDYFSCVSIGTTYTGIVAPWPSRVMKNRGGRAARRQLCSKSGSYGRDRNFNRDGSTIGRRYDAITVRASALWRAVACPRTGSRASRTVARAVIVGGAMSAGPIRRAGATVDHADGPRVVAGGGGDRVLRRESGRRRPGGRRVSCSGSQGPGSMGGSARQRESGAPHGCGGGSGSDRSPRIA